MNRDTRLELLSHQLMAAQFDMLVYSLNLPAGILLPKSIPQAERAVELLRWAEANNRIQDIDSAIRRILNPVQSSPIKAGKSPKKKPLFTSISKLACPACGSPLLGSSRACSACEYVTESSLVQNVVDLYRLLGYEVTCDGSLSGKPTEMLCVLQVRGAPVTRIYAKCETVSGNELSADIVRKFVFDFQALRSHHQLTGGVLICNKNLTQGGQEILHSLSCRFFTYEDLIDELLNVATSLRSFTASYESEEIHKYYIPLSYLSLEGLPKSLINAFDEWLANSSRLLVLLGDFGTGKTTFLDRVKYELSLKYMHRTGSLIPIKILLRDFESIGTIDRFIEHQFQAELHSNLNYSKIVQLLRSGRFVLLLDGFDEMGQQVNARIRKAHFEALVPLISACPKTVLTCRPNYLVSDRELDDILSRLRLFEAEPALKNVPAYVRTNHAEFLAAAKEVNAIDASIPNDIGQITKFPIAPFTDRDIDIYVAQYSRDNFDSSKLDKLQLRERIRTTYDLEDLARRPILLNIIVRTLPHLPPEQEASPCIIYEVYTNSWMQHDYAKGAVRMLVPPEQKSAFTQNLAWALYRQSKVSISHNEFEQMVSEFFDSDEIRKEFLSSHMQFCSFLSRDSVGNFRFIHKSFMEYFAAEYLRSHLLDLRRGLLSRVELSGEVCFFLGDLVHTDVRFGSYMLDMLREALGRGGNDEPVALDIIQRNLLRIFSYARVNLDRFSVVGQWWDGMRFIKDKLSGSFRNIRWTKLRFLKCDFTSLQIRNMEVSDVLIGNTSFSKCDLIDIHKMSDGITLESLKLQDCNFSTVRIANRMFFSGERLAFDNCEFNTTSGLIDLANSTLSKNIYHQSNAALKWNTVKTSSTLFYGGPDGADTASDFLSTIRSTWGVTRNMATWTRCTFDSCVFFWWDFSRVLLRDVEFRNCKFIACRFLASKKHKQFFDLHGLHNQFYALCLSVEEGAEKDKEIQDMRSDRKLLASLEECLTKQKMDKRQILRFRGKNKQEVTAALDVKEEISEGSALWLLSPRTPEKLSPPGCGKVHI